MKKYILDAIESTTLLEIAQDAIDRGMLASYYEMDSIESIIDEITNGYGDVIKKNIKITVEILD